MSMRQEVIEKPRNSLKPDPDNPRQSVDEAEIERLAAELKLRGILCPLLVRPDDVIIDGFRRWLASPRAGIEKLPCIVTARNLTPGEILAMQMATMLHHADITPFEKWKATERLKALNPAWRQKDIAENMAISEGMVTNLLAPGKCVKAWQDALRDGLVGISDCYRASGLDPEAQAGLLALKLSGAGRDELARAGRKKRDAVASAPAVRVDRAKLALPSGVSIVVSGSGLSLDMLIDSLLEAAKEARRALGQGLDIRTVQAVFKDKAKAGTS